MTISELQKALAKAKRRYGDIEVRVNESFVNIEPERIFTNESGSQWCGVKMNEAKYAHPCEYDIRPPAFLIW